MRAWLEISGLLVVAVVALIAANLIVVPFFDSLFPGVDAFFKSHQDFGLSLIAVWLVYVWQKGVYDERLSSISDKLVSLKSRVDDMELLVRG